MEFIYLVFTRTPGGVTVGDSGLCCCVPCLPSTVISLCFLVLLSPVASTQFSSPDVTMENILTSGGIFTAFFFSSVKQVGVWEVCIYLFIETDRVFMTDRPRFLPVQVTSPLVT